MLVVLAQAHSLSDLFTRIADLNVAGSRASDLKTSLASDLAELQQEQQGRGGCSGAADRAARGAGLPARRS